MACFGYDEFGLFHENAEEFGLPFPGPPAVRREAVEVAPGRQLSSLVWGEAEPELVLLHGGAQNAHTWDTVAMALDRPLLAVDLPGHGHSDNGCASSLSPVDNASDVAVVVREFAPHAEAVVGMSLGGLTAIALGQQAPELLRRLVLVDITPGVTAKKADSIMAFVHGPASFSNFEEILGRTIEFNPTRSESSLRRGVLHNAIQLADGTWMWRYRRFPSLPADPLAEYLPLWEHLSSFEVPIMLVRGMRGQSVVDDADEEELLRRQPAARVEHVVNAGHSVQGDAPLELARLLASFVTT